MNTDENIFIAAGHPKVKDPVEIPDNIGRYEVPAANGHASLKPQGWQQEMLSVRLIEIRTVRRVPKRPRHLRGGRGCRRRQTARDIRHVQKQLVWIESVVRLQAQIEVVVARIGRADGGSLSRPRVGRARGTVRSPGRS